MKPWAAAIILAVAGLAGRSVVARPAVAKAPVTLADLLQREGIEYQVTRAADLGKPVTSGEVLDTAKVRIVATYVAEERILGDRVYVFRRAKPAGTWRTAEVRWPRDSPTACHGGSITRIVEAGGFLYLDGHLGPSSACTMVLDRKLALYDTWPGWPKAALADGRVVFEASQSHTRFGFRGELSLYDPKTRRSIAFHPPQPVPALRRAYLAKFRAVCARCCGETVPQDCGAVFLGRNHPCDPDQFSSSIGEVVVNDDTGAFAFKDRFEDLAGNREVVYVYRRPRQRRGGAFEFREIAADPGEPGYGVPLASLLTAERLRAIFAVE
jgi:hypothetical protein